MLRLLMLVNNELAPQLPAFDMRIPRSGDVHANALLSASSRLGGAHSVHPLLITSKNEDHRRTLGPSATERRLMALGRQRAKLVPMLAMCRISPARRARLRAKLANVDEMIRLVNRIGLH